MNAVIVDDEQSARLTLRSILEEFFPDVKIVGEASAPSEAVTLIRSAAPDVVFMDVQMQLGSGFDVLESLPDLNFHTIFISAHKEFAYQSFRVDAVDYILKPVRIKDLREALEKVRAKIAKSIEVIGGAYVRGYPRLQEQHQLVVPDMDGFSVILLSEIVRCESSRNYTTLYLVGGRTVVASRHLGDFEALLAQHGFLRIHKSHIVNLYRVRRYIKGRGGEVEMDDNSVLPVSRERKDELVAQFIQ